MSDHDFEKQVHQKLEELKLRPSDAVWMEVERNIRKDKRRRYMWLWMAALFIGVTVSGYVLYNQLAQTTPATLSTIQTTTTPATTSKQTITTNPVVKNSSSTDENINTNSNNAATNTAPQTSNEQPAVKTPAAGDETIRATIAPNEKQPAIAVTENNTNNTREKTVPTNNKKQVQHSIASTLIRERVYTPEKERTTKKQSTQPAIAIQEDNAVQEHPVAITTTVTKTEEELNVTMPATVPDIDNTIATIKAVTTPVNSKLPLLLLPDSLSANTAAAMPIERKRPSLWHWGIITDAGYSRIAESKLFQLRGLLGTEKYLAEDLTARYQSSPATNNSLLNFSSSTATVPVKSAAPIQPDFAFSAGLFVQRALSGRFKISLGVEYSYMSVNTQVGQKTKEPPLMVSIGTSSTVIKEYYKTAGSTADIVQGQYQPVVNQKYKYRFQYIEIPLMANWQINKGRRLPPIVFEGGLSLAHLLKVDGLHYEGINGVYYKDNDLFNKTQFNFVTGVSVGLLQRSKHPIWIGPDLRYSLNGLVNKQVSTGQYLWSTGISVKMLLGKL